MSGPGYVARLPQRCRCGGVGELHATYDLTDGIVARAAWMAICDVCGAATVSHTRWRTARKDWLDRRCPWTYREVGRE
ncbi:MAG: hypothetical protein ACK52I_06775 [Pseudomonadota bacterium]